MSVETAQQLLWSVLGVIFVGILLGSPIVWSKIVGRLSKGESIVPFEPHRAAPWVVQLVVIVGACLAIGGGAAIINRLMHPAPDEPANVAEVEDAREEAPEDEPLTDPYRIAAEFLGGAAIELVMVGVLLLLLVWFSGATAKDFGLDFSKFSHDIRLGLLAFLAVCVPTYGLQLVMTQLVKEASHPVTDAIAETSSGVVVLATIVLAVLVAPLVEELLFRVLLQGWLESIVVRRATPDPARLPAPLSSALPETGPLADAAPEDAADVLAPEPDGQSYESAVESYETSPANESIESTTFVIGDSAGSDLGEPMVSVSPGWMPILLTSMLFALAHISYGPSAVPLFFFSLALGYLYQQTHRIWPSLVVHMSLNSLTMLAVVADLLKKQA